ncbi:MAG: CotH kinase family protein [Oscillospiraceae bacterium]
MNRNAITVRHKLIAVFVLAFVFGASLAGASVLEHRVTAEPTPATQAITEVFHTQKTPVVFSQSGYFYTATTLLELQAGEADVTDIYYTIDATPPDTSDTAAKYTEGILLIAPSGRSDDVKSYTIKACGKKADGSFTKTVTHSYFIGAGVTERFDTYVFSISTDPYNLYDYDYGIFVPGRLRDDYMKDSGNYDPDPPEPANYNLRGRASERPAFLEVLDGDGNQLLSQNIGIRTFGGWSRAMEQKSIQLFARGEYDKNNKFSYDFFGDTRNLSGTKITAFDRLILRNNANDNPFSFMRDEVIQECASQTPLDDTQAASPASVFLNGEYYGLAWLKQVYDNDYFDDKYGTTDGQWGVVAGGEQEKEADETDPLSVTAAADYEAMYAYSEKDLTDDAVFAELTQKMDVENFLYYYAIQLYIENEDWPGNNYKAYRYYGAADPASGTATDGRWRWLLFDTDFGLGLYGKNAVADSFGRVFETPTTSPKSSNVVSLLQAVLKRPDMRLKFSAIMCDLMNGAFSYDNVAKTAAEKAALRNNELMWNFKSGGAQLQGTWSSLSYVREDTAKLLTFAQERPDVMKNLLVKYLGVSGEGYTVDVDANTAAQITVGDCSIAAGESFSGFYFNELTTTLTAAPTDGQAFAYWLVNGRRVTTPTLELTGAGAFEGAYTISLVTEPADCAPVISEVNYAGTGDYFVLSNPSGETVSLSGLYVSDDAGNLCKQKLPNIFLQPGESFTVYCDNYAGADAIGQFGTGFSLKKGETLFLCKQDQSVAASVALPDIGDGNSYIRDPVTKTYFEQ